MANELRKISKDELQEILKKHKEWVESKRAFKNYFRDEKSSKMREIFQKFEANSELFNENFWWSGIPEIRSIFGSFAVGT